MAPLLKPSTNILFERLTTLVKHRHPTDPKPNNGKVNEIGRIHSHSRTLSITRITPLYLLPVIPHETRHKEPSANSKCSAHLGIIANDAETLQTITDQADPIWRLENLHRHTSI